jgi:hypothetical protein
MKKWLRRIRGALGMGVIWMVPWMFVAFLIEIFVDPHGQIADIWPAVLGFPAFVSGVFLSVVLGIAERRRKFDELSVPRFTAWGAVAGLLVSVLPFVLGDTNASVASPFRLWVTIAVPMTVLSAGMAAGTLLVARKSADQDSIVDGPSAQLEDPTNRGS